MSSTRNRRGHWPLSFSKLVHKDQVALGDGVTERTNTFGASRSSCETVVVRGNVGYRKSKFGGRLAQLRHGGSKVLSKFRLRQNASKLMFAIHAYQSLSLYRY